MESDATPLALTDTAYWLEGNHEIGDTNTETAPVEVQESTNTAGVGLLALLAVFSLTGAALVASRSDVDVSDAKRRIHERRYDEWISTGSIPMWIGEHHLELDTLEDVVDVAIDTNERVVHDTQRDLFAVVNDDVVYYYSDRGGWGETAWPTVEINHDDAAVSGATDQQQPRPPSAHGTTETPAKRDEQNADAAETADSPESDGEGKSEGEGEGEDKQKTAGITKAELPDPNDEDAWEQI